MQNYFKLLGLEPDFALDLAKLETIYFQHQRQFHPDRQITKSAAEKQKSLLVSMEINAAYQTLKDPLKRAQHLLELQGIRVNTDGQDTVKPSPELLMEMMTLREEISECHTSEQWEQLDQHGDREWESALDALSLYFQQKDWQNAAIMALRLRYLEKFCEELRVLRSQRFKEKI